MARTSSSASPPTGYGQYPSGSFGTPAQPQVDYIPPASAAPPPPAQPARLTFQASYQHYTPPYNTPPLSAPGPGSPHFAPAPGITVSNKNDSGLIAETILSLFGIFGVGWLLAGETTVGIVLLVCSVFVYWPLMILGTAFTFGFGLICLGPLAIGAIILNTVLLNNTLNRKATKFVVVQQTRRSVPPQPQ